MHDVALPTALDGSFLLAETRWPAMVVDTAERFEYQLARRGFIVRDDPVTAIARSGTQPLAQRSVQRHFRLATGMTPGLFTRIERARLATNLLRAGTPILDWCKRGCLADPATA